MAVEELQTLLQRAQAGDRDALGKAFERLTPFLLQLANDELDPRLKQKASGSDIVQQTLLEAGQSLANFEGSSEAFMVWLRRILHNNIANQRRQFRTKKRSLNREVRLGDGSSALVRIDSLTQASPSQSDQLVRQESLDSISCAMESLTPDYRRVIEYRNEHKLSFQEIGQLMDRSPEAARKLWGRAIEALKAEIDRLEG